jgi:long-chain acyl-CoA synthetase
VALIIPDAEFAASWAKDQVLDSKALDAMIDHPNFKSVISDAVYRVNGDLSVIERVRRFTLTAEAFTIDNAMMTPTLKIRRHVIREKYGETLEALYGR